MITEKTKIRGGIFLRMNVTTIEKNEEIMKKFIRYCKNKYGLKEYAGCLEKSLEGYLHIHLYINQYLPLKEINKKGNELSEFKEDKGNIYMIKVENEEHKFNILKYIGKEPIRIWVCQSYKELYGGQTGYLNEGSKPLGALKFAVTEKKGEKIENISMDKAIFTKTNENTERPSANIFINDKKANREDRKEKMGKFICAEHKREESEFIYKKQKDLEKELIVIKSLESVRTKGGKNYKQNVIVLKGLIKKIEPYIIYKEISKNMSEKRKQIMLLNMVYIGLQLQNCRRNMYLYYKIGEKLIKYYDINKLYYKNLLEKNKDKIKNIKKITKTEGKQIYKEFYKTSEFKKYKEKVIQVGVKHFVLFEKEFYDIKEVLYKDKIVQQLSLKLDIEKKIEKIINISKVKKYKYLLPLIEKPEEGGPELEKYGGYHLEELRKPLVKENINEGHDLIFNYKRIYPIVNKLQSIEYKINKEGLDFILENKEKIYELLLMNVEKGSKAYETKKEQFDITINIASYMSKYEKFYFTYELDYRGRLYPKQEYLNYQGNLLARSLIQGYTSKKKQTYGLKIACVSLYKSILNLSYKEVYETYQKDFLDLNFMDVGFDMAKQAKEPILGLNLFFELKINKYSFTNYIIWFDATCSGSQLISLFVNDKEFMKELNLYKDNKINDYYTAIYEKYGKFKDIKDLHARKIVKKVIMTINYGLTRIGCHRYIYLKLKELQYCNNKKEYKEKGEMEFNKFYDFILNLSLVKSLEELQELGNKLVKNNYIYEFVIGATGIMTKRGSKDLDKFIFKSKTFCYRKYYKNLSLYNKSRKMKEKGYKYLGHYKQLNKREQYRKVKANLIHLLDATGNILTCEKFAHDIATIHDCHGLHSYDVLEGFEDVKFILVKMFEYNKYFYLLEDMLYQVYEINKDKEYYKEMNMRIFRKYEPYLIHVFKEGGNIRSSKYMFVPK